jgi:2-succinyl-6-hydroxy-2,4-cyclohexadiene-1-carboxylate synthase
MLVLHGFTETDLFWNDLLGPQLPHECALLPGHGWKPCPAGSDLASVAADFAKRLPAQGGDLVGYSLGGRIALQLALDHPGRVKRLALVSCLPGLRDGQERQSRRERDERIAQILEEEGLGSFLALWENIPALKPAHPIPHRSSESIRSMRMNQDPKGLAAVLRSLGVGSMPSLWERLGTLKAKTLLVAGASDSRYASAMSEMAGIIPDAHLEIVADSGHAVHREQPLALRRLLTAFFA